MVTAWAKAKLLNMLSLLHTSKSLVCVYVCMCVYVCVCVSVCVVYFLFLKSTLRTRPVLMICVGCVVLAVLAVLAVLVV